MGAAHAGVGGQGGEPIERGEHLRRRALEQSSAAQAEERIAAEQQAVGVVGDMAARVTGHANHLEGDRRRIEHHARSVGHAHVGQGNAPILWCVHGGSGLADKRGDAALVIVVMVRDQDRPQAPAALLQGAAHRRCIARIDRHGVARRVGGEPQVVVVEGRNRQQVEHGSRADGGARDYTQRIAMAG